MAQGIILKLNNRAENNIVADVLAPPRGFYLSLREGPLTDTDYNFYYCEGNPALGKTMLEKQQGDGVDSHSLAVDPLFVDPEQGEFRFKPDSPALKLGFVAFDMSKVGLIENLATD